MPRITINTPSPYQTAAERYHQLIVDTLNSQGLDVPGVSGVVMVRPAEDCCPDLTLWVDNVRPFDIAFPSSLNENRILTHFAVAFDVFVRFGQCYIESGEDGEAIEIGILTDWTQAINAYIDAIYTRPIFEIAKGCVEEFGDSGQTFLPSNLTGYNLGGCAGYEYSVTFGLFT